MSLNGALQVGQSAILASQAAISVAGNNMANAATPGYHRQRIGIMPGRPESIGRGQFTGTGVQIGSITRQIDVALQARMRTAIGDQAGAMIDQRFLASVELLQNELSGADISSQVSAFFNSWSELANNPTDSGMRSLVLQQGESLAGGIRQLRGEYVVLREEADRGLGVAVERADAILDEIAQLNISIAQTEQGVGQANTLRDQRDGLIDELSELIDVTTIDQANGAVDVLVGSLPVVISGESRGLELRTETVNGLREVSIRIEADGSDLMVSSGTIGGLLRQREQTIEPVIQTLDQFTSQLIFEVNRVHSQGQGARGWSQLTSGNAVSDPSAALNASASELPFRMENGSFLISLTDPDTGSSSSFLIEIDPDLDSLDSVASRIQSAIGPSGGTAEVGQDGTLQLTAPEGQELSFSEDSGGFLAALGINSFFNGSDGSDVAVNDSILSDSSLLATGSDFTAGSNGNVLKMVELRDKAVGGLSGRSLREFWESGVNDLAVRASAANTRLEGAAVVTESLFAQNQAVSGVSLDEEAIDLLSYQRQFQAAARYLSVIDETLQSLLSIA
ncbi:MAG: flagellar hook-associated protein FlgK [Planctomycetota bacterium]|nr:flagellar hook-associated protein FlgK [Planctomycetota bacterium]MEC8818779.1 flagellar hook-associated protein FlgK [Planctomycetota bacterium]MEC9234001.1 flagellar hook-associated protein FlgK [Planctomycetota bacterium]